MTVNNVDPAVSISSLTGNAGTACVGGNTVTLSFTWTDPANSYDVYGYIVKWGDKQLDDRFGCVEHGSDRIDTYLRRWWALQHHRRGL